MFLPVVLSPENNYQCVLVRMRLSPSRDQGEGESRRLQSATRPLCATKSYTQ